MTKEQKKDLMYKLIALEQALDDESLSLNRNFSHLFAKLNEVQKLLEDIE